VLISTPNTSLYKNNKALKVWFCVVGDTFLVVAKKVKNSSISFLLKSIGYFLYGGAG
jgi:hypothetical protein